jgi:methionine-rich copper-binding protein CopC
LTTGVLPIGGQVTGNLEVATDEDWFKVSLQAGITYSLELRGFDAGGGTLGSGTSHQPYLSLYDANGYYLKAAYNGGVGGDPLMTFTPSTTGSYFVSAVELFATGTGTYTFRAAVLPNQPPIVANPMLNENWIEGVQLQYVMPSGTFADPEGGVLSYSASLNTGAALPSWLSFNTVTHTFTGAAPIGSPDYSVRVRATDAGGLSAYNDVVFFTVGDDYAGSNLTAGRLVFGGSSAGQLEIAGDRDWFAISLIAGKQYVFSLDSSASNGLSDPYLDLYGSNSVLLASDDDSGSGLGSLISYTAAVGGTYYLSASSGSYGSGTGAYVLSSYSFIDDYAATTATTGRMTVGGSSTGQLELAGDKDWFSISLSAGQQYVFKLDSSVSNGLADPYLDLYSSSAVLLTSDDDSGFGLGAEITYTAAVTGTYYLSARSGSFGAGTGGYVLSAGISGLNDFTSPTVSTLSPADEATGAATSSNIVVTFNEPVQRGAGSILIKTAAGVTVATYDAATSANLSVTGNTLTINPTQDLGIFTDYSVDIAPGAIKDLAANSFAGLSNYNFKTSTVDSLYNFFVVAFNAAPGVEYMNQLAEAYNYGLTVSDIVNIFTTKSQFTSVYPQTLTHAQLATSLVGNIVKNSASDSIKAGAVADITAALDIGWSVGRMIYQVFGNVAAKALDDPTWGTTAKQFHNELAVARYYTEVMGQNTTDLPTLRSVIGGVDQNTDVSTPELIAALIGVATGHPV